MNDRNPTVNLAEHTPPTVPAGRAISAPSSSAPSERVPANSKLPEQTQQAVENLGGMSLGELATTVTDMLKADFNRFHDQLNTASRAAEIASLTDEFRDDDLLLFIDEYPNQPTPQVGEGWVADQIRQETYDRWAQVEANDSATGDSDFFRARLAAASRTANDDEQSRVNASVATMPAESTSTRISLTNQQAGVGRSRHSSAINSVRASAGRNSRPSSPTSNRTSSRNTRLPSLSSVMGSRDERGRPVAQPVSLSSGTASSLAELSHDDDIAAPSTYPPANSGLAAPLTRRNSARNATVPTSARLPARGESHGTNRTVGPASDFRGDRSTQLDRRNLPARSTGPGRKHPSMLRTANGTVQEKAAQDLEQSRLERDLVEESHVSSILSINRHRSASDIVREARKLRELDRQHSTTEHEDALTHEVSHSEGLVELGSSTPSSVDVEQADEVPTGWRRWMSWRNPPRFPVDRKPTESVEVEVAPVSQQAAPSRTPMRTQVRDESFLDDHPIEPELASSVQTTGEWSGQIGWLNGLLFSAVAMVVAVTGIFLTVDLWLADSDVRGLASRLNNPQTPRTVISDRIATLPTPLLDDKDPNRAYVLAKAQLFAEYPQLRSGPASIKTIKPEELSMLRSTLEGLIRSNPANVWGWLSLAEFLRRTEPNSADLEEAIARVKHLNQVEPAVVRVLAECELGQKHPEAATKYFRTFLTNRPEETQTILEQLKAAGLSAEQYLEAVPENIIAESIATQFLRNSGQTNWRTFAEHSLASRGVINKNEKLRPADEYAAMGTLRQLLNQSKEAIEAYSTGLSRKPGRHDWRLKIANLYYESGNYAEARKLAEHVTQSAPASDSARSAHQLLERIQLATGL